MNIMEVSPSTKGFQLLAIRDYILALLSLCPTGGDRLLPALDVYEAHATCGEFYERGRISINATDNFLSREMRRTHTLPSDQTRDGSTTWGREIWSS